MTMFSISNFENGERVDVAARKRLHTLAERFPDSYFMVSFSGGKDSTAMLRLALDVLPNDRLVVVYFDIETETPDTHQFIEDVFNRPTNRRVKYCWITGDWKVRNATEHKGRGLYVNYARAPYCWQHDRFADWFYQAPFDCSKRTITYWRDKIIQDFAKSQSAPVVQLIGITKFESLNRLMATTRKRQGNYQDLTWTTVDRNIVRAYPIFDWRADDVWAFVNSDACGLGVNKFYAKMSQATGLPISKIRTENVLHGCGLKHLGFIKQLYPDFYSALDARGLIGNDWGNLRGEASKKRRIPADGEATAKRWGELL